MLSNAPDTRLHEEVRRLTAEVSHGPPRLVNLPNQKPSHRRGYVPHDLRDAQKYHPGAYPGRVGKDHKEDNLI